MSMEALLGPGPLDAAIARRDGVAISRRQFLADAAALAERLPPAGAMLNLSVDRYLFAVGLGAAVLRGQACLLPPNHTPHTVERLRSRFAGTYALVESEGEGDGLPEIVHAATPAPAATAPANPRLAADGIAAHVLTSGSTGDPLPHAKPWGLLAASARTEAARLAQACGRDSLEGVTLVATVPPQHMYGFESSVLIALHGGAAFDVGRPFYPADVVAALAATPAPRALVTTPFHLKALLESGLAMPEVALIVCATAPLSPQLAARSEAAFRAPLVEIYGCTEAGQVATRRTTAGAEWQTFAGLTLAGDGDRRHGERRPRARADAARRRAGGPRRRSLPPARPLQRPGQRRRQAQLAQPSRLPPQRDRGRGRRRVLEPAGERRGRRHPPGGVRRRPGLGPEQILAALRTRVDAAFLPRRIVAVEALPREPTGKLTAARLAELAAAHGAGSARRRGAKRT